MRMLTWSVLGCPPCRHVMDLPLGFAAALARCKGFIIFVLFVGFDTYRL